MFLHTNILLTGYYINQELKCVWVYDIYKPIESVDDHLVSHTNNKHQTLFYLGFIMFVNINCVLSLSEF